MIHQIYSVLNYEELLITDKQFYDYLGQINDLEVIYQLITDQRKFFNFLREFKTTFNEL